MSQLLGFSADIPVSPKVSFDAGSFGDGSQSSGWGIAWYPEQEMRAAAIRDATSRGSGGLTEIMADWDLIRTPLMLTHMRVQTSRAIYRDTHPFIFNFRGSSWTLSHTGELMCDLEREFPIDKNFALKPLGPSDSEHVFCWLMNQVDKAGVESIEEFGFERFVDLLRQINRQGTFSCQVSDGRSLVTYRCATGEAKLYWYRTSPTAEELTQVEFDERKSKVFQHDRVSLDVMSYSSTDYSIAVASTVRFTHLCSELEAGGAVVFQRGSVVFEQAGVDPDDFTVAEKPKAVLYQGPPRRNLLVVHTTNYAYEKPVERSVHKFRLAPTIDQFQRVFDYRLDISVDGFSYKYGDVFGNQVLGVDIDATYQHLEIRMESKVDVKTPIDNPDLLPEKITLPIFWMPWQAKMMQTYLLPQELPESQLRELTDYAKSFAARNKGELLSTLEDITTTIKQDFEYTPGFTDIETTPFEVFHARKGVCQDFANLMICVCRMLNIPARYRVGYIYTGADYENKIQSEASHAWVEAYIPNFGWRGYDPTNGAKVSGDHIRVAAGRNYIDATPTSGVVWGGGGKETMDIAVQVTEYE